MSRDKSNEELKQHKADAIAALDRYLTGMISSTDIADHGRADKLCYWLRDYVKFLDYEKRFDSEKLRRYKRGDILKVHLGYNIGSEEGGLHYAVVLDRNNSIKCSTVTVIPLTSVKPTTDIQNLRPGNVYLGNELFTNLNSNASLLYRQLKSMLGDLLEKAECSTDENLQPELDRINSELYRLKRMRTEIQKMKKGSIALTRQITTISKIRIYDPKTSHDVLSWVRLSNEKLDAIDNAVSEYFIGKH